MDFASIITIIIAVVIIYCFIRFIAFPVVRVILGIIIFLLLLHIAQRFFGFDINNILAPFGISFDLDKWGINLDWLLKPVDYYLDQVKNFFIGAWDKIPKSFNK